MSVLLSKVDKAATIPFDSLPIVAGCDTTWSGLVGVRGCITVTHLNARLDSIRVDVGTTVPGTRPDTIFMRRSRIPIPVPMR